MSTKENVKLCLVRIVNKSVENMGISLCHYWVLCLFLLKGYYMESMIPSIPPSFIAFMNTFTSVNYSHLKQNIPSLSFYSWGKLHIEDSTEWVDHFYFVLFRFKWAYKVIGFTMEYLCVHYVSSSSMPLLHSSTPLKDPFPLYTIPHTFLMLNVCHCFLSSPTP